MKKVVLCIDGMMVGCPATYEKSGVMHRLHDGGLPSNIEKVVCMHRWHDGGLPSNIEKSGVMHRLHDGGLPSNIEKVVLCIDCMMVGCPAT
jgi:hypothetical protein